MKSDKPLSVLLLEDEALIAYDLEDHLKETGFRIAGVLTSCAQALAWLKADTADIVILDIELRDGICEDVVKLLQLQKIPFIIHSADSHDPAIHDAAFLDGIWVSKPCAPDDLVAAVAVSMSQSTSSNDRDQRSGQDFVRSSNSLLSRDSA